MFAYPASIPLDELTEAGSIISAGEVTTKAKELAQDLWAIQGFAQKMLIGERAPPDSAGHSAASPESAPSTLPELTHEHIGLIHTTSAQLNQLYQRLQKEQNQSAGGGFGSAPAPFEIGANGKINWSNLLQLAIKLLPLILPLITAA